MWRKYAFSFLVAGALILVVAGCANLQSKWQKLTPDEKARVVCGDLQARLCELTDTGEAYVKLHPQVQPVWIEKVVPAIKVANDALGVIEVMAQTGTVTPADVYAKVDPLINDVVDLLTSMGVIVKVQGGS